MFHLIVILIVIAAVAFFFSELSRINRERTIKSLILIYLENASPMTFYDIQQCLGESGFIIRQSTYWRLMLTLEKENRIEHFDIPNLAISSGSKIPARFYRLTPQVSPTT